MVFSMTLAGLKTLVTVIIVSFWAKFPEVSFTLPVMLMTQNSPQLTVKFWLN